MVGSVARLAQGDLPDAGIDFYSDPISNMIARKGGSAAETQEKGYDSAIQGLQDLATQSKQFQMQGLKQAEDYYLPAQQMNRAVYGDPGALKK